MSQKTFRLPDLGEGLTESEIVTWRVAEGDAVTVNQVLADVETAKAVVEVSSPFAGVVAALHGAEGETLEVGAPLVTFTLEGAEPDVGGPADVGLGALEGEGHQGRTDLEGLALGAVQGRDDARERARDLDHGLGRLDVGEHLVHGHRVALGHAPRHDLGLGQALAEVGQAEGLLAHRVSSPAFWAARNCSAVSGAANASTESSEFGRPRARSRPSRMRSRSGRCRCSSLDGG